MPHVFAYGTLQLEEIVHRLCGKTFKSSPAKLFSYRRQQVKGCDYPAILPSENHLVDGTLIFDVDDLSMQKLIYFEGDEYKMVDEVVQSGNKKVKAKVFVWKNSPRLLSKNDWNLEQFKKESLYGYLVEILPQTLQEFNKTAKNNGEQNP